MKIRQFPEAKENEPEMTALGMVANIGSRDVTCGELVFHLYSFSERVCSISACNL